MKKMKKKKISLKKAVGKSYNRFWKFKGRYRVVKGSRASKKSKTSALWYITNIMKHSGSNLLVIRKTYRTLKDSCFTELKWAGGRMTVITSPYKTLLAIRLCRLTAGFPRKRTYF